jgi:hypothetical protein
VRTLGFAIALLAIGVLLAVAACGGSSSSSATPIVSPTVATSSTPAATDTTSPIGSETPIATPRSSCSAANLAGAIINTGAAAGTEYYTIGISNTGANVCTLPGAPVVGFTDAGRALIFVAVDTSAPRCGSPPIDAKTCVDNVPIQLAPGSPTPNGPATPGQVTVTVAIANALNFEPSPILTYQASSLYLTFADAGSAVSVPFTAPVTLIPSGQVSLRGYGPSS